MMQASCLCGSIRFSLDCELRAPRYCYCKHCTKFAGTSPASWAVALMAGLDVSMPTDTLAKYDSGKGLRCFCSRCGSPVWFESKDHPEYIAIPLGVLDAGNVPSPAMHIWVGSKPGWCTISDDLPRFDKNPG